ncbi:hypothetical protein [Streptomyces sioyaensis]|uniref:hypothetical protein n=1 Tax=Streptomyces sioyaensis TaxID=67364 RepID=UPI0037948AC5
MGVSSTVDSATEVPLPLLLSVPLPLPLIRPVPVVSEPGEGESDGSENLGDGGGEPCCAL